MSTNSEVRSSLNSGWRTPAQIARAVGWPRSRAKTVLKRLFRHGLLQRELVNINRPGQAGPQRVALFALPGTPSLFRSTAPRRSWWRRLLDWARDRTCRGTGQAR